MSAVWVDHLVHLGGRKPLREAGALWAHLEVLARPKKWPFRSRKSIEKGLLLAMKEVEISNSWQLRGWQTSPPARCMPPNPGGSWRGSGGNRRRPASSHPGSPSPFRSASVTVMDSLSRKVRVLQVSPYCKTWAVHDKYYYILYILYR